MGETLDSDITEWDKIHMVPFVCTHNNKFIIFQYKILNRILATNSFLYKLKLKETNLCTFCNETKESIMHLFWECPVVRNFWIEIKNLYRETCNIELSLSASNIILGSSIFDISTNYFIILIKYFIYSCRLRASRPALIGLMSMLKTTYSIEKLSAAFHQSPAIGEKIEFKWAPMIPLIE